jgi:hypothetical protein
VPLTPWPLLPGHLFTRCASLETRARASARSSPSPTDAPEFTGAGTPGISVRPLLGLGIRLSPWHASRLRFDPRQKLSHRARRRVLREKRRRVYCRVAPRVKALHGGVPFPARGRVGVTTPGESFRARRTSWATLNQGEFHAGVQVWAGLSPPRGRLASADNHR